MSIEEAIYKYTILANSHHRKSLAGLGNANDPHLKDRIMEAEYRQLANWLQELKERREKESRAIEIRKPYLTVQVDKDMVERTIDKAINNLYYECQYCGAKMTPQRKEESK